MKLVKSLLLGSAAGLFAVAGAQAADLPVRKAAPVDYVRVCSTYGAGYWFIPGTDTCMRISGFVRADYLFLEQSRRDFDTTGFRARGRLNFDFRQPTEYGLLRAFIRYEITRNSGSFVGAGRGAVDASGVFFGTGPASTADIPLAYVQFGGLTAGRVQSFYDFYANDDTFTTLLGVSDLKTQALAYTATFGGGWSATIAIEDPQERRKVANFLNTTLTNFGPGGAFITPGVGLGGGVLGSTVPQAFVPAGARAPDVVANIRIDQSWGAAQLSAAAHELRANNIVGRTAGGATFVALPGAVPGNAVPLDNPDSEWGYAIQGGVRFNLPMIAAGDQLWLQAAFASGALGYTNIDNFTAARAGTFRLNQSEAVVNPFTGDIERTDSFSVSGKFLHYWAPNLRSNFFGAYSEVDYDAVATTPVRNAAGQTFNFGFSDLRIYEAGVNLIWTPVKQLDIGVEAVYRNIEVKGAGVLPEFGQTITATGVGNIAATPTREQEAWEARLRIQRDF